MNSTIKNLLIFGGGVAAGAVATYFYLKDKFEQYAQEEIYSVKEHYKAKSEKEKPVEETKEEKHKFSDKEVEDYKDYVRESGYVNYSNYMSKEEMNQAKENGEYNKDIRIPEEIPYIIQPEEFGEEEGYDTQTLTYFADKVLVDDLDDEVEDPDTVVGLENLKVFDEFNASSVYVRNDIFRMDYEILKDDFKWSDMKDPFIESIEREADDREKKPHEV